MIIGAGPAGLSAAVNALTRGKTVRILSAGDPFLKKAERVDNYLGLYHVSGKELMASFLEHVKAMGVEPEIGRVVNILPFGDQFMVNFNSEILQAKTVVLALGASSPKQIPGEGKLLGHGVSYCATCDGMLYRGKEAVVYGQSDGAAGEANFLHSIGVKVTYVTARERPAELSPDIPYLRGTIAEILGSKTVTGARVGDRILEAQGVFLLRNSIAPDALMDGLEIKNGFVVVNSAMETSIPGVFACGDCTGKPLQVSKAVGEGLIAGQQAAKYLDEIYKEEKEYV